MRLKKRELKIIYNHNTCAGLQLDLANSKFIDELSKSCDLKFVSKKIVSGIVEITYRCPKTPRK